MTATVDMLRIKNTNLNSGNLVNMFGIQITPGYKKNTQVDPIEGQLATGSASFLINTGQQVGIENPVFTVSGVLNLHDYSNGTAMYATTSLTNVTPGYLQSLWRDATGNTIINIKLGAIENQVAWRTYDGLSEDIPVVVQSYTPLPRLDSDGRHIINYTLVLREIT